MTRNCCQCAVNLELSYYVRSTKYPRTLFVTELPNLIGRHSRFLSICKVPNCFGATLCNQSGNMLEPVQQTTYLAHLCISHLKTSKPLCDRSYSLQCMFGLKNFAKFNISFDSYCECSCCFHFVILCRKLTVAVQTAQKVCSAILHTEMSEMDFSCSSILSVIDLFRCFVISPPLVKLRSKLGGDVLIDIARQDIATTY